jgi:WD40 repeat protein
VNRMPQERFTPYHGKDDAVHRVQRWLPSVRALFLVGFLILAALAFSAIIREAAYRQALSHSTRMAANLQLLYTLDARPQEIAWAPDSRTLATVSYHARSPYTLDMREAQTGQLLASTAITPTGSGLIWLADGSLIRSEYRYTSTILLIDASTLQVKRTLVVPPPEGAPPLSTLQPDLEYIFGISSIGSTPNGQRLATLSRVRGPVYRHDAERRGPTYTTLQIWDISSGQLLQNITLQNPDSLPSIDGVTLSLDGRTLAVEERGYNKENKPVLSLQTWDISSGSLPRILASISEKHNGLAWSPDSNTLALIDGESVRLLDAKTGQLVKSLPETVPPTYTPSPVPTSPPMPTFPPGPPTSPPRPVTTANYPDALPSRPPPGFTPLTATPTWTASVTPTPDRNIFKSVANVAWALDGKTLAVYDLHTVKLWDTDTGQLESIANFGEGDPFGKPKLAWAPNGVVLAGAAHLNKSLWSQEEYVALWDPATGRELRRLEEGRLAQALNWSPDSRLLAISSGDKTEVWGIK